MKMRFSILSRADHPRIAPLTSTYSRHEASKVYKAVKCITRGGRAVKRTLQMLQRSHIWECPTIVALIDQYNNK